MSGKPQLSFTRFVPGLVLIIGVALTCLGTVVSYQQAQTREQLRLKVLTERIRADATEQLGTYVSLVRSGVGFVEASDLQVTRAQFRRFLAAVQLDAEFPGVLALGYIRRIPAAEKDAFELEQAKLTPGYHIFPDTPRPEYFAATYVEPPDNDRKKSLGFDPFSEPVRRAALEKARDTATPIMTGRLILKNEEKTDNAAPAFVLYAPIYSIAPTPRTVEERRASLHGFIAASFRVNDLLKGIRGPTSRSQVAFRVYAGKDTDPRDTLMETDDFPQSSNGIKSIETISIAGFPWTFEFVTLPEFSDDAGTWRIPYIATLGVLLSILLFGLTSMQTRAKAADERALHHERGRAKDLQELDRAKTRFFSNLSHELRTPLNGILGMTDLLWDTNLDEQQKDYLTTVGTCGRTLLDLISDVLDVSKIEAGKMELQSRPFKLMQPFTSALEVVRGQARGKDLRLSLDWDENLPRYVEGDLVRLRQVLVNLMSNAIKFTTEGSVTLRAVHKPGLDGGRLEVEIQDTGVGISPDNIAKLFRPFSQPTTAAGSETIQGTGLGLVICKELTDLMGGSISLTSQPGVGTVFRINLPLHVVSNEKFESVSEPQVRREIEGTLNLLVADDNPVNLRVLMLQLQKLGYAADGVDDGQKAVDAVASKSYDLVLMDCQMPVMDGLEATRTIRRVAKPGPIIVALTAHAQPEQRAECEAAGMDDFLTKPIELARLVRVLDTWKLKLKEQP